MFTEELLDFIVLHYKLSGFMFAALCLFIIAQMPWKKKKKKFLTFFQCVCLV